MAPLLSLTHHQDYGGVYAESLDRSHARLHPTRPHLMLIAARPTDSLAEFGNSRFLTVVGYKSSTQFTSFGFFTCCGCGVRILMSAVKVV